LTHRKGGFIPGITGKEGSVAGVSHWRGNGFGIERIDGRDRWTRMSDAGIRGKKRLKK
jgi:hypothetical protein